MRVLFFPFCKERNSTKTPKADREGVDYVAYDCTIDEPFNILHPSLRLNVPMSQSANLKYCYISDFSRYYYIISWVYRDGYFHAALDVDPMATFKTIIGSSTQYILRAEDVSIRYGTIPDPELPMSNYITKDYETFTSTKSFLNYNTIADGCYIVGIINSDSNAVGSVSYYIFTAGQFNNFKYYLMSSINWLDIDTTEISQNLQKVLANPFEYIASVKWFPFSATEAGASSATLVNNVKYGWWTLNGISCYKIPPQAVLVSTYTATRPFHPQVSTHGRYVNSTPFTDLIVFVRPFGTIVLDSTKYNLSQVKMIVTADLIGGNAVLNIYTTDGSLSYLVETHDTKLAVDIALSNISAKMPQPSVSNMITAAGSFIASLLTTEGDVSNSINTSFQPVVQTLGSNGGFADYFQQTPYIVGFFRHVAEPSPSRLGYLVNDTFRISTIANGYIKCYNAHIDSSFMFDEEIVTVSNYLNGGFYYE